MEEAIPLNWRKYPERYRLEGTHCKKCGEDFYPKRSICPNCRRKGELKDKEMPRKGKIVSYSKVKSSHKDFSDETPYYVALIELKNGVRVFSQVIDSEEKVKTGAEVKKVFRKVNDKKDGVIAYSHKFKVEE